MTEGTKKALRLGKRHNLHTFKADLLMEPLSIGSCKMKALRSQHDAAEGIVFQVYDNEDRVLYSTDTVNTPIWNFGEKLFTKMIIETNFAVDALENSDVEFYLKERIKNNHSSIERVVEHFEYMKQYHELDALKEIHLIHISKRHGNGEEFKTAIQKVVGDIPIYAH